MWQALVASIFKGFLDWLAAGIQRLVRAYMNKAEDERTNRGLREQQEQAQTPQQRQEAVNDLAGRLGRN